MDPGANAAKADHHGPAPAVSELAVGLLDRIPELTDRLVEQILATDPVYREVIKIPREELWTSCCGNLAQLINKLIDPRAYTLNYLGFLTGVARRRVELGLPLESLLHAYRIGARLIWDALREESERQGHADTAALVEAATLVWQFHEATSSRVADAYRDAELERLRRRQEQRYALIDALLEGRGQEPGFARAAASVLGLRPVGRYVIVVVESQESGGTSVRDLERILAVHGASAWRAGPQRKVGIVDLADAGIAAVAQVLREGVGGRIGISPVSSSLGDLPAAHQLAETALSTIPEGRQDVAILEERLPAALLVRAPDIAGLIVQHVLGPVLALTEDERVRLLEVLRVYAETGGSGTETARRLYCHRNTVLKRLRRFEQLTGKSLGDPSTMLAIALATQAVVFARTTPREC